MADGISLRRLPAVWFALTIAITGCSPAPPDGDMQLEALLSAYTASEADFDMLTADPASADRSMAAEESARLRRLYTLNALEGIETAALSQQGSWLYEASKTKLETLARVDAFGKGLIGLHRISPFRFSSDHGLWLDLRQRLLETAKVASKDDASAWLAALASFEVALSDERRRFQADLAAGQAPPSDILNAAGASVNAEAAIPPEENPLCLAFAESLSQRADLATPDLVQMVGECRRIIGSSYVPALRTFAADLQEAAAVEGGNYAPDKSFHAEALAFHTSGTLSSEQALAVADAIRTSAAQELRRVLAQLGAPASGTLQTQIDVVERERPPAVPPAPAASLEADRLARLISEIEAGLKLAERITPLPSLPVPTLTYADLPPSGPPLSTPTGVPSQMLVDMARLSLIPVPALAPLVHQTVAPGAYVLASMKQGAAAAFSDVAFTEGWALYAMDVAFEEGTYDEDLRERARYLRAVIGYAALLSADIRHHVSGMSREACASFLSAEGLFTPEEAARETQRIILFPGRSGAAMIGREKLRNLREDAELELGRAFDIREFHGAVLAGGPRPLGLVEKDVRAFIDKVRASGSAPRDRKETRKEPAQAAKPTRFTGESAQPIRGNAK